MKKLLSVILSFLIIFLCAFGVVGCRNESNNSIDNGNNPGNSSTDNPPKNDPPEEEPPAENPPEENPPEEDPPVDNPPVEEPPENEPTDDELLREVPVTGDDLAYIAVEENGVVVGYTVSGFSGEGGRVVVIPEEYNSLPVTGIDEGAFDGEDIYYITVPKSIKAIGANAFARCDKLRRVYISDIESWCNTDFESMASNPMYFASQLYLNDVLIKNLVIPDSVVSIPAYAFYECENLESVTVGRGVTEIGEESFYNCKKLKRVVLKGAIESMVSLTFAHCEELESLQIGNEVKEIGYYAFYECKSLKEVTIPSSVKSIGESAFSMCVKLEQINFNEGLEYIGDCAFMGCYSLEEFIMPDSVTEIGFGILMFLGSYAYDGDEGDEVIGENSIRKIVISDRLTEIPQFAFSGCNMRTITIGKSVETIDYAAFYLCDYLESVVLSNSVKRIISYAFYNCHKLDTVYYGGSQGELAAVYISREGNAIATAQAYYFSEEQPASGGNFWHYGTDGVTPEKW